MKKIEDLAQLIAEATSPMENLKGNLGEFCSKLDSMEKEFKKVNPNMNISYGPQFGDEGQPLNGIVFSLNHVGMSLMDGNTNQVFVKGKNGSEFVLADKNFLPSSPAKNTEFVEFSKNAKLFMEIVEDQFIDKFLTKQKNVHRDEVFQGLQKKKSGMRH